MARTLYRLTDRIVRTLDAHGYHADGGGLYLQVSKSGTKSWVFRFALRGRTRDAGLGSTRSVSLAEARARAAEYRSITAKGVDPIGQARPSVVVVVAPPGGPTFREFADQYIDARVGQWKNAKHREQWRTTLAQYAYPVIGNMRLAVIDTPDVLRILEPMWSDKSETASRLRGRIERVLAAASVRGLRPAANPAAWRGHLKEALPPKARATPFRALPHTEIPAFMAALRSKDSVGARALEFAILTAARSGEARGARWPEIDETARLWAIPADRMKAGRAHLVPLSAPAFAVLGEVKALRDLDGGFLFPGVKSGRPLSDMTLTKLLRSAGYDVTAHGFRASFKTWAEERTDHPNVVIEASLAHIVGDKAERAYMRGDWFAKRRALMSAWGDYCISTPLETVVPMRRAAWLRS